MHCRHNLENTTAPRCTECGRAFDPADASSFRKRAEGPELERASLGLVNWLAIGCFGVPYLLLLAIQISWLAAWFELGRRPEFGDPLPKNLTSAGSQTMVLMTDTLSILTPLSIVLCVTLLAVEMIRSFTDHERARCFAMTLMICFLLFICALGLLFVTVVMTPAGHWMMD